jgi:hypothetical protein
MCVCVCVCVCVNARLHARAHTRTHAHTQERSSADWQLKQKKGESNEVVEAELGERAWQVLDKHVFRRSQSNFKRIRLSISNLPVLTVV